jgi:methylenetetrahydrofolate dehydrogenase (NADP+)/methenyltetrahydrofolate cyclohydrolase
MILLDGNILSATIKDEIRAEVEKITSEGSRPPHLAAILVGDDPASHAYVGNKVKSCEAVGYRSTLLQQNADISQDTLMQLIRNLNEDPEIDGFIVQLPLPPHIDANAVTMAIRPEKDVDGFHPVNIGRMTIGLPSYLPATPYGILQMLERNKIRTSGMECCILGRSNIVGTPMSVLLSRKGDPGDATVTLCHSRTKDIGEKTRKADLIIAAIGIPLFLKADMVKEGAVVIDVGINRVPAPERKSGSKLVGDVDFDAVAPKCSFITPVPGGVGPMTVTSLMLNTLKAYRQEVYRRG